jgi:RHS repeat-associated protein
LVEKNVGGNAGALIQETVWLGELPVATLRPNGSGISLYYVHADQLGTPRIVSRPSDNTVMWRWDSDPFGTTLPNQNPQAQGAFVYNLRLPGNYYQSETGLNYNYFRDYDPSAGRYLESDPIGLRGGVDTYAYVEGNPISNTDPLGLDDSICAFNPAMCGEPMAPAYVEIPSGRAVARRRAPHRRSSRRLWGCSKWWPTWAVS